MTGLCNRNPQPRPMASRPGVARCSLRSKTFARPFYFLLLMLRISCWGISMSLSFIPVTEFCYRVLSAFKLHRKTDDIIDDEFCMEQSLQRVLGDLWSMSSLSCDSRFVLFFCFRFVGQQKKRKKLFKGFHLKTATWHVWKA